MKVLLKICICTLGLLLLNNTNSFAQKFGHLNSIELLNSMPEWKSAQKSLETYANQKKQQLQAKEKALIDRYQRLMARVQKGEVTQVEQEREGRAIQEAQKALEKSNMQAQQEILKKEQSLTTPIRDKVLAAIKKVANTKGYTYIFDTSIGSILYAADSEDVTTLVKSNM